MASKRGQYAIIAADRSEITGECKSRRLSVSKYRDGVEGPVSGYELKHVVLGENEDGEPFGSCAIVATEEAAADKAPIGYGTDFSTTP